MTPIEQQEQQQANRIKVVEFLREQMPEKRFRFDVIQSKTSQMKERVPNLFNHECGTMGCVMGWTPAIFPDQVEFYEDSWNDIGIRLKVHEGRCIEAWPNIAEKLFGIEEGLTSSRLFSPSCADLSRDPVPDHPCAYNATPIQVADRLETYFKAHPLPLLVNETAQSAS